MACKNWCAAQRLVHYLRSFPHPPHPRIMSSLAPFDRKLINSYNVAWSVLQFVATSIP